MEGRLYCVCNGLAKKSIHRSQARSFEGERYYLLLREKTTIFEKGKKLTNKAGKEVRHCLGKRDVMRLYTGAKHAGGLIWTSNRYDQASWDSLRDCLDKQNPICTGHG